MRAFLLGTLCLVVAACSGGQEPAAESASEPAPAPAGQVVNLELTESVVSDGQLHLRGTTDAPDGAILHYRVEHEGFASGDFDGQLLGELTVADGAFSADLDVEGWPRGHASVWISLEMNDQPANVVDAYGPTGERLAGPNVITVPNGKKLEIKTDVEIP